MIIWRGYGVAVIGVAFASSLVANILANYRGGPGYWDAHGWPLAASLFADAIILWSIDAALVKRTPRTLLDEATGERVVMNKYDDFFFLRIRWWALIFASLAVAIFLTGWSPGHL